MDEINLLKYKKRKMYTHVNSKKQHNLLEERHIYLQFTHRIKLHTRLP